MPAAPPGSRRLRRRRRATSFFTTALAVSLRDGHEYVITLSPGQVTPAPWVNVLANPSFGTVVSENGSAYTWVENAHEFRLTPWYNDPVRDPTGEAFYIRDEETGQFWSPTPGPARGASALRHSARFWLHRFRAHRARHRFRVVDLRGDGRAGEARGFETAQHLRRTAPPLRHRLLRMGAGRFAPQNAPQRPDRCRSQDRRAAGSQFLQYGIPRPHRLPRCQ